MKNNKNDVNKAIETICKGINKNMNEFQENINDMINKLYNDIELIKKQINEAIKRSLENVDNKIDIQGKNNINYKEISFDFFETLYNNLGPINAAITGGIGGGLVVAIIGFNFIPGVGTLMSLLTAGFLSIVGFIVSPSKEKQLQKLIDKIIRKFEDGFYEQKCNFTRILDKLEKELIVSYKKEIGISCLELNKDEQKDFEDKKELYFKMKKILME